MQLRVISGGRLNADHAEQVAALRAAIADADAVLVGAGAGLSTSAGFTYSGERFEEWLGDFGRAYGFDDMYTGGFYPFPSEEARWAYWSRFIYCNRYLEPPHNTYQRIVALLAGKDAFALTTNVDHCFQKAGWQKERLFYTQGDYGLWQCSVPCHSATYDNESQVKAMVEQQQGLLIPSELVPTCPRCGEPMAMNLRADDTFVEDAGWHAAAARYQAFVEAHTSGKVLYLELGVGGNTPVIIKYPFWRSVMDNPQATYACINYGEAYAPEAIAERSILINADIHTVLGELLGERS